MITLPRIHRVLFSVILLTACSPDPGATIEIRPGQTRDQVRKAAGDPDEIQEFTLPAEPFFGPQEGLANLLPAGALVEEWQYQDEAEITYVWFSGKAGQNREAWTVVSTAILPVDAVY